MNVAAKLRRHHRNFRPRERVRHLVWARQHVRGVDGQPYLHESYPHTGAPGGPFDALDDPKVRRIWQQFGSRLSKTFSGQCALMKKADCNPGPGIFASSVEKVASEVVERTYKMIVQSPRVAVQLRPESERRQSVIDFAACQCFVAWSRSVSTLADKEAEFGHANEIDKWEQPGAAGNNAKEADPLKLFLDRFKNRPHHKVILESTPTVKGKSRVETGRIGSTNCQYFVPCPHCQRYQTLKMEHLRWDKLENGRSDKDLAQKTAFYVCEHCQGEILDHHRPEMMRAGVWCPEGCTVKDDEARKAAIACASQRPEDYEWRGWEHATWIEGTPLRDGPDAGYKLSSLYALTLAWGDIAAEFVSCKDRPQDLRNFINGWLAETWSHVRNKATWEQLGIRIIDNERPRGIVPLWASLITIGIDRQQDDGNDRFPWVIDAWGPGYRCGTIAYAQESSFDELFKIVSQKWKHADGRGELGLAFGLFDTGFLPHDIDDFCIRCNAAGLRIFQCKGSNLPMRSDWEYSVLGPKTARPGMPQYMVDTIRSQLWIEAQLAGATKDDPEGYSLHKGSVFEHQDFLEQLLNDAPVDKLDSTNNVRQSWERVSSSIPNDYRACRRYARAAMLIATRNAPIIPRGASPPPKKPVKMAGGGRRPDGRQWIPR